MATTMLRRFLGRFGIERPGAYADLLFDWWQVGRQRRALAALDDHTLQDIGLTRCDVEREVTKPFWRL